MVDIAPLLISATSSNLSLKKKLAKYADSMLKRFPCGDFADISRLNYAIQIEIPHGYAFSYNKARALCRDIAKDLQICFRCLCVDDEDALSEIEYKSDEAGSDSFQTLVIVLTLVGQISELSKSYPMQPEIMDEQDLEGYTEISSHETSKEAAERALIIGDQLPKYDVEFAIEVTSEVQISGSLLWEKLLCLGLEHQNEHSGPLGNQSGVHSFSYKHNEDEDDVELCQVSLSMEHDSADLSCKNLRFSFFFPYTPSPLASLFVMNHLMVTIRKELQDAKVHTNISAFYPIYGQKRPLKLVKNPSEKFVLDTLKTSAEYLIECMARELDVEPGDYTFMDLF